MWPQLSANGGDESDALALRGDACVLVGYGAVQGFVDVWLSPLAKAQPALFIQEPPVFAAPLQGLALAALWVAIVEALGGYRISVTRALPSAQAILPLFAAWLGSSLALLAVCSALQLPLDGEVGFVVGSATVIASWRLLVVALLPPL